MGPKAKKGGKKKEKKGRKKKKEKPIVLTKTEYLQKIAERNAVLAAARSELKAIEDIYFEADKKHEDAQKDKADILKFLEHELQENEDEIAEFEEKIAIYERELKKNDAYYDTVISKKKKEYDDKEALLQNQIQLVNAKIMTLEDIRHQLEEYRAKKKELLERVQETVARQEEEIYEAEKSVITKQDQMQTEMETHLTTLAADFRQATDIAIGETSNKMIKDNIVLGNMLTCMQEILEHARTMFHKLSAIETRYRLDAETLQEEHYVAMDTYLKRTAQIEILVKNQEELKDKYKSCQKLIKDNRRLQRQYAEKECIWKDKVDELEELLKVLEEYEKGFISVQNEYLTVGKNFVKLQHIIYEAAKKVKDAIDVEELILVEESEEEPLGEVEKEELDENLKDTSYQKREHLLEEVVERLQSGLQCETETLLPTASTESYAIVFKDSVFNVLPP